MNVDLKPPELELEGYITRKNGERVPFKLTRVEKLEEMRNDIPRFENGKQVNPPPDPAPGAEEG